MSVSTIRSRYLADGAHLLRRTSQTTSSVLSYDCQSIGSRWPNKVSDMNRSAFCGACGSLKIIHKTIKRLRSKSTAPATAVQSKLSTEKAHCFSQTCPRCHRSVRIQQPPSFKTLQTVELVQRHETIPITSSPMGAEKTQAKLTSKQRAKTRKERTGLQGLLSSQRPSNSPQTFDLMDFMR